MEKYTRRIGSRFQTAFIWKNYEDTFAPKNKNMASNRLKYRENEMDSNPMIAGPAGRKLSFSKESI